MRREPVSHVEHLSLFYGKEHASRDIGTDIERNKVTAFTEPSGCGKSTFLCCLNRMGGLIEGCRIGRTIELSGVGAYGFEVNIMDLCTQVGMVFQKPNLFPMSIYDSITRGLKCQRIKNRKTLSAIVEQSLRKATLWEGVRDRPNDSASGSSGGQQQRLCTARAIIMESEVIPMGEPTSALDPITMSRIEDLMEGLKKDYTTVIVAYSMQQAFRVSDYTVLFLLSEVVEFNKTNRVLQQPRDKRTEDYITGRFRQKEGPMIKIDKKLDIMEENVLKIEQKVIRMYERVVQALDSPNKEIELEIVQSDDIINHLEEEINDQAVCSLALLSPVANDPRKVVANVKIASELECIGDYAKDISILLVKRDDMDAPILNYAQTMEKGFIAVLQEAMTCYENRDIDTAFEIPKKDRGTNALYRKPKEKIRHGSSSYPVEHILEIFSILRNIERVGDHTKNIREYITYMIKGQHHDFGQTLRFM